MTHVCHHELCVNILWKERFLYLVEPVNWRSLGGEVNKKCITFNTSNFGTFCICLIASNDLLTTPTAYDNLCILGQAGPS